MKKALVPFLSVVFLGLCGLANATLWDRGGGLVYDDVLSITWLKDANYARTSGYDGDGSMNWGQVSTWVDNLAYYDSIRNITWTDWRLPRTMPVNGTSYNYAFSAIGLTDFGYNISAPGSAFDGSTGSEMAYMYYNNLRNRGRYDLSGKEDPYWGSVPNAYFESGGLGGPLVSFRNLDGYYWSETTYAPDPTARWFFRFNLGDQLGFDWSMNPQAWPVRDGDVQSPVPEPASIFLLGIGLLGISACGRKLRGM